jgi:hypothetical protein
VLPIGVHEQNGAARRMVEPGEQRCLLPKLRDSDTT